MLCRIITGLRFVYVCELFKFVIMFLYICVYVWCVHKLICSVLENCGRV